MRQCTWNSRGARQIVAEKPTHNSSVQRITPSFFMTAGGGTFDWESTWKDDTKHQKLHFFQKHSHALPFTPGFCGWAPCQWQQRQGRFWEWRGYFQNYSGISLSQRAPEEQPDGPCGCEPQSIWSGGWRSHAGNPAPSQAWLSGH